MADVNRLILDGENVGDKLATYDTTLENLTVDYVVEQGTSGIWYYRKWNSGMAECWGAWNCSATGIKAEGNVFWSDMGNIVFPSGLFAYTPVVDVTVGCGTSMLTWCSLKSVSTTQFSCYYVHDTSTDRSTIQNHASARGWWK